MHPKDERKISYLADLTDNSLDIAPVDLLRRLVKDIEDGNVDPKKMTIMWFTEDNEFEFQNSNMTLGESSLMLAVAKDGVLGRFYDG